MRSSSRRAVTAVLLAAVLAVGVAAPALGQASGATTTMRVDLEADGDAHWTVSAHFSLADANETEAFDRLADEHVGGTAEVLVVDPYEHAVDLAAAATDRPMVLDNVSRAAERTGNRGALRLSFDWTNFSRVEANGSRLVLGDVFRSPSGTWLPGLNEGQVLVVAFPEGYSVRSSSRALDNGTIRVEGPATFEPGEPSATLERTGGDGPGEPPDDLAVPTALTAGAVLAIVALVAYVLYRRRREEVVADGEAAAADAAEGADEPATPPEEDELLSDEERVLRLLRSAGGRMKQVDIVEETDWSNAKVSQLLSAMAEEGRVEKLRIGRENLISLPGEDEDG